MLLNVAERIRVEGNIGRVDHEYGIQIVLFHILEVRKETEIVRAQ